MLGIPYTLSFLLSAILLGHLGRRIHLAGQQRKPHDAVLCRVSCKAGAMTVTRTPAKAFARQ